MKYEGIPIVNFFGDDARFEHIGIAVRSINDKIKDIKKIHDPIQRVNVSFIYVNSIKIELIEPTSKDSPVNNILSKGQRLYHLCFKVPDLERAIIVARENGFHRISSPVPARAYNDRKVLWVYSNEYGLFELIEGQ